MRMEQYDAQRIRALCERLAAFIEENDAVKRGPITMDGGTIYFEYTEGQRRAWVEDRNGEKWWLSLTKRMTEKHPTGTDTIHEIRIDSVLDHAMGTRSNLFPEITLKMGAYPTHQMRQYGVREALAACAIPVSRKYLLQWESGQQVRTPLALDAWTQHDEDVIVVEFDLDSVERLVEEICGGIVVKDDRMLQIMRQRAEYDARVQRAYDHLIVLTEGERRSLHDALVPLGAIGGPDDASEYMAMSMADLADWLASARVALEGRLFLQAFERGADCVILGRLEEDGGLVTARLVQQLDAFAWKDVDSGVQRLARMRGVNAREVIRTREVQALARDVAVLTRGELARVPQDNLDVVATLDASLWSTFVGSTAPSGLLHQFLQRKAAALGGTMVVYDGQPEDRITGATVYRARAAAPA